jgi:putative sigma-54 modulation protein
MNLNVSGHRLEVTPAIRGYVGSKRERVKRHFDHVIDTHVILSVGKLHQSAGVTPHLRGRDLHCASVEPDLYAAIDRQVLKHKGKRHVPPHDALKTRAEGPRAGNRRCARGRVCNGGRWAIIRAL